jgi:hypothetical protein
LFLAVFPELSALVGEKDNYRFIAPERVESIRNSHTQTRSQVHHNRLAMQPLPLRRFAAQGGIAKETLLMVHCGANLA